VRICLIAAVIIGLISFGFAGEPTLAQQGIFEQQTLTDGWGEARKQLQDLRSS
jgi:hypothetical protein